MPRRVTLGVTGGVAAYKAAELVRLLQGHGLDVRVVMTEAATRFVQPLTFAALTGHRVVTDLWDEAGEGPGQNTESQIEHIALAQATDLLLIAPATANTLARLAHGVADDFLGTLYLATTAPVIVAPAMNVNMWQHPATRANVACLRARGVAFVEPGEGYLACGMTGGGRLAELDTIVAAVLARLHAAAGAAAHDLAGETVLITAGGTREPLDPVRYLGNRSSGRMGYALAGQALGRGARVILISAPTALAPPAGCEFVPVIEARQMQAAVLERLPQATVVIAAAAVADFRPVAVATHKLRRAQGLTLTLEPTEDIVRLAAERRSPGTLVIAFAAETDSDDLLASARAKLVRKGVDAVVANDVSLPGLGFDSDRNAATFVTAQAEVTLPESSKAVLAGRILDEVRSLRGTHERAPARAFF